jgi:ketosteroid isomerase-like protein
MQLRRQSLALLLSLLAGPFVIHAAEPGLTEAGRAMVEAEKKFYQTGQENGTRAAFLAFLADDAVIFRPGPVNGKQSWEKRAETGLDLIWEPTFAAIARSADFGYTTGPARWKANKKDEKFLGYGQFVSIWKKQNDGSWKVALDVGIENPEPAGKPEPLRLFVAEDAAKSKIDSDARRNALQEAQRKLEEAAKTNSTEATLAVAADEIRVYREGSLPAIGKNAATVLLKATTGKISLKSIGGDTSQSADLAYTYGKYSGSRAQGVEFGYFFQVWQTDVAGAWKLVLDWQQALPKDKP